VRLSLLLLIFGVFLDTFFFPPLSLLCSAFSHRMKRILYIFSSFSLLKHQSTFALCCGRYFWFSVCCLFFSFPPVVLPVSLVPHPQLSSFRCGQTFPSFFSLLNSLLLFHHKVICEFTVFLMVFPLFLCSVKTFVIAFFSTPPDALGGRSHRVRTPQARFSLSHIRNLGDASRVCCIIFPSRPTFPPCVPSLSVGSPSFPPEFWSTYTSFPPMCFPPFLLSRYVLPLALL